MSIAVDYVEKADQLVEAGRFFFERGWAPATSGNLSARLSDGSVAITVYGRHKGRLNRYDIMIVDASGRPLTGNRRPSAETLLHIALYRRNPELGAVLHSHSVQATVLSLLEQSELLLCHYELLKAFPGINHHNQEVMVPIVANDQDMTRLADTVEQRLQQQPSAQGYLIAGHGLYSWGESVEAASQHIEAFEFLFECELLMRRVRG